MAPLAPGPRRHQWAGGPPGRAGPGRAGRLEAPLASAHQHLVLGEAAEAAGLKSGHDVTSHL